MQRFVVLHHRMPAGDDRTTHWDLMLQLQQKLLTWALERWPPSDQFLDARRLPDHRLHYLSYEGAIADRGSVQRIDQGEYELDATTCSLASLVQLGDFHLVLHGQQLVRRIQLRRAQSSDRWQYRALNYPFPQAFSGSVQN